MPVIQNPYVIGSICFLIICLGIAVLIAVIAPNGLIKSIRKHKQKTP